MIAPSCKLEIQKGSVQKKTLRNDRSMPILSQFIQNPTNLLPNKVKESKSYFGGKFEAKTSQDHQRHLSNLNSHKDLQAFVKSNSRSQLAFKERQRGTLNAGQQIQKSSEMIVSGQSNQEPVEKSSQNLKEEEDLNFLIPITGSKSGRSPRCDKNGAIGSNSKFRFTNIPHPDKVYQIQSMLQPRLNSNSKENRELQSITSERHEVKSKNVEKQPRRRLILSSGPKSINSHQNKGVSKSVFPDQQKGGKKLSGFQIQEPIEADLVNESDQEYLTPRSIHLKETKIVGCTTQSNLKTKSNRDHNLTIVHNVVDPSRNPESNKNSKQLQSKRTSSGNIQKAQKIKSIKKSVKIDKNVFVVKETPSLKNQIDIERKNSLKIPQSAEYNTRRHNQKILSEKSDQCQISKKDRRKKVTQMQTNKSTQDKDMANLHLNVSKYQQISKQLIQFTNNGCSSMKNSIVEQNLGINQKQSNFQNTPIMQSYKQPYVESQIKLPRMISQGSLKSKEVIQGKETVKDKKSKKAKIQKETNQNLTERIIDNKSYKQISNANWNQFNPSQILMDQNGETFVMSMTPKEINFSQKQQQLDKFALSEPQSKKKRVDPEAIFSRKTLFKNKIAGNKVNEMSQKVIERKIQTSESQQKVGCPIIQKGTATQNNRQQQKSKLFKVSVSQSCRQFPGKIQSIARQTNSTEISEKQDAHGRKVGNSSQNQTTEKVESNSILAPQQYQNGEFYLERNQMSQQQKQQLWLVNDPPKNLKQASSNQSSKLERSETQQFIDKYGNKNQDELIEKALLEFNIQRSLKYSKKQSYEIEKRQKSTINFVQEQLKVKEKNELQKKTLSSNKSGEFLPQVQKSSVRTIVENNKPILKIVQDSENQNFSAKNVIESSLTNKSSQLKSFGNTSKSCIDLQQAKSNQVLEVKTQLEANDRKQRDEVIAELRQLTSYLVQNRDKSFQGRKIEQEQAEQSKESLQSFKTLKGSQSMNGNLLDAKMFVHANNSKIRKLKAMPSLISLPENGSQKTNTGKLQLPSVNHALSKDNESKNIEDLQIGVLNFKHNDQKAQNPKHPHMNQLKFTSQSQNVTIFDNTSKSSTMSQKVQKIRVIEPELTQLNLMQAPLKNRLKGSKINQLSVIQNSDIHEKQLTAGKALSKNENQFDGKPDQMQFILQSTSIFKTKEGATSTTSDSKKKDLCKSSKVNISKSQENTSLNLQSKNRQGILKPLCIGICFEGFCQSQEIQGKQFLMRDGFGEALNTFISQIPKDTISIVLYTFIDEDFFQNTVQPWLYQILTLHQSCQKKESQVQGQKSGNKEQENENWQCILDNILFLRRDKLQIDRNLLPEGTQQILWLHPLDLDFGEIRSRVKQKSQDAYYNMLAQFSESKRQIVSKVVKFHPSINSDSLQDRIKEFSLLIAHLDFDLSKNSSKNTDFFISKEKDVSNEKSDPNLLGSTMSLQSNFLRQQSFDCNYTRETQDSNQSVVMNYTPLIGQQHGRKMSNVMKALVDLKSKQDTKDKRIQPISSNIQSISLTSIFKTVQSFLHLGKITNLNEKEKAKVESDPSKINSLKIGSKSGEKVTQFDNRRVTQNNLKVEYSWEKAFKVIEEHRLLSLVAMQAPEFCFDSPLNNHPDIDRRLRVAEEIRLKNSKKIMHAGSLQNATQSKRLQFQSNQTNSLPQQISQIGGSLGIGSTNFGAKVGNQANLVIPLRPLVPQKIDQKLSKEFGIESIETILGLSLPSQTTLVQIQMYQGRVNESSQEVSQNNQASQSQQMVPNYQQPTISHNKMVDMQAQGKEHADEKVELQSAQVIFKQLLKEMKQANKDISKSIRSYGQGYRERKQAKIAKNVQIQSKNNQQLKNDEIQSNKEEKVRRVMVLDGWLLQLCPLQIYESPL